MKTQLKDKLVEAANRIWRAFLQWEPVDDGRPEGDEFDEALLALRSAAKRTKIQTSAERKALVNIINAANEFTEPIHWKVRESINHAAEVLRETDLVVDED